MLNLTNPLLLNLPQGEGANALGAWLNPTSGGGSHSAQDLFSMILSGTIEGESALALGNGVDLKALLSTNPELKEAMPKDLLMQFVSSGGQDSQPLMNFFTKDLGLDIDLSANLPENLNQIVEVMQQHMDMSSVLQNINPAQLEATGLELISMPGQDSSIMQFVDTAQMQKVESLVQQVVNHIQQAIEANPQAMADMVESGKIKIPNLDTKLNIDLQQPGASLLQQTASLVQQSPIAQNVLKELSKTDVLNKAELLNTTDVVNKADLLNKTNVSNQSLNFSNQDVLGKGLPMDKLFDDKHFMNLKDVPKLAELIDAKLPPAAKDILASLGSESLKNDPFLKQFQNLIGKSQPNNQSSNTPLLTPAFAPFTPASPDSPLLVRPLQVSTPVGQGEWTQQFNNQVLWLGSQQFKSAAIKLTPAELGPVEINIKVVNDVATVQFNSHSGQVRDLIEQAVPRLREMMQDQGIQLADVDVQDKSQQGLKRQAENQGNHQGDARQAFGAEGDLEADQVVLGASEVVQRVKQGLVDYFA